VTELTRTVRWCLVTAGVLSFCSAIVIIVVPGVDQWINWPWNGELLLVAFFTVGTIVASLLSPFVLIDDLDRPREKSESPESIPSTPTPGDELDRLLGRRSLVSLPPARRRRLRTQFRETAVRTIVRTSDCSADAARTQLDRGSWTTDPVAAAFVRPSEVAESSRLRSLVDRILFRRRARRTARAIRALAVEGGPTR